MTNIYRCRNKVQTMKPRILEHHCHEASEILSETLILLQTNKPPAIVIVSTLTFGWLRMFWLFIKFQFFFFCLDDIIIGL